MHDYFIFFPPGYEKEDVHEVVDVSDVWSVKEKAMKAHSSQINDVEKALINSATLPKEEYFLIVEK